MTGFSGQAKGRGDLLNNRLIMEFWMMMDDSEMDVEAFL